MEHRLFRKKSIERISSPEEIHGYVHVTTPRLWMLLGAIALLLVGFVVYAATATMENVLPIQVELARYDIPEEDRVEGEEAYYTYITAELPATLQDQVKTGMTVRLGNEKGSVTWIGVQYDGSMILDIVPEHPIPLPDGIYDAELVLESTTPISFLWN